MTTESIKAQIVKRKTRKFSTEIQKKTSDNSNDFHTIRKGNEFLSTEHPQSLSCPIFHLQMKRLQVRHRLIQSASFPHLPLF